MLIIGTAQQKDEELSLNLREICGVLTYIYLVLSIFNILVRSLWLVDGIGIPHRLFPEGIEQ